MTTSNSGPGKFSGHKPLDELSARSSPCFGVLWRRMPQCAFCPLGVRHSDCHTESNQNMEEKRIRKRLLALAISGRDESGGETMAQALGLDMNGILDLARDLTQNERSILLWRFEKEYSFRKIAAGLRLHPEQVRRGYARALSKVQKALKQAF